MRTMAQFVVSDTYAGRDAWIVQTYLIQAETREAAYKQYQIFKHMEGRDIPPIDVLREVNPSQEIQVISTTDIETAW